MCAECCLFYIRWMDPDLMISFLGSIWRKCWHHRARPTTGWPWVWEIDLRWWTCWGCNNQCKNATTHLSSWWAIQVTRMGSFLAILAPPLTSNWHDFQSLFFVSEDTYMDAHWLTECSAKKVFSGRLLCWKYRYIIIVMPKVENENEWVCGAQYYEFCPHHGKLSEDKACSLIGLCYLPQAWVCVVVGRLLYTLEWDTPPLPFKLHLEELIVNEDWSELRHPLDTEDHISLVDW